MTKNLIIPKLLKLQDLLCAQNHNYMYQVWSRSRLIQMIEMDIDKYKAYTSRYLNLRGLSSDDLKFWNKVYMDLTENKA